MLFKPKSTERFFRWTWSGLDRSWKFSNKARRALQTTLLSRSFHQWIKKNEGLKIEDEILSDAFQEIDYLMETPFRKALKEASKDLKLQIRLWHKHREGVVKSLAFLNL